MGGVLRRMDVSGLIVMRVGKNSITGEGEVYLSAEECELMKAMVRGASLPLRRVFHKILGEL